MKVKIELKRVICADLASLAHWKWKFAEQELVQQPTVAPTSRHESHLCVCVCVSVCVGCVCGRCVCVCGRWCVCVVWAVCVGGVYVWEVVCVCVTHQSAAPCNGGLQTAQCASHLLIHFSRPHCTVDVYPLVHTTRQ